MNYKNTNFNEEELYKLNIHELRDIAREIGVSSPTTKKKEELISCTLAIIYGEAPARSSRATAGRPVRNKTKPSRLVWGISESGQEEMHEYTDNLFTSRYSSNPEKLFGDNLKVASSSALYMVGAVDDDVTDKSLTIVEGTVVEIDSKLKIEVIDSFTEKTSFYLVSKEMAMLANVSVGDIVEALVNTEAEITAKVLTVNGDLVL